jgi:23S rRNA (guanosine2251-2'-O)-methyltransferase
VSDRRRSVVAGRRAVTEAIRAGGVSAVLIVASSKDNRGMRTLLEAAGTSGVPVRYVPRGRLDALAERHQGVVATFERDRPRGTEVGERALSTFPFDDDAIVVLLDGVTDPQNLGAAARSAEAAGVSMLVTRTRRAADVTPAAIRASAGALLHLPHARVANIAHAIERLQGVGFWVVGLADDATDLISEDPSPPGRVAVVIGSEGSGMSRLVRARCDALVALPMHGRVGSLNAAASLAAVLYAWILPSRSSSSGR